MTASRTTTNVHPQTTVTRRSDPDRKKFPIIQSHIAFVLVFLWIRVWRLSAENVLQSRLRVSEHVLLILQYIMQFRDSSLL